LEIIMAKSVVKRKKPRATRRANAWDQLPMDKGWHAVQYHIHYLIEAKEWLNKVKSYIKKNYDKTTVSNINKLPDWKIGGKSHWATAAHFEENAPDQVIPDYKGALDRWIKQLAEEGAQVVELKKAEEKTKKKPYVPTIQERLEEATIDKLEELDNWLDDWMRDSKKNPLIKCNPLNYFRKQEMNLGHLRFVDQFYRGPYEELQELNDLPPAKKQDDMQQQLAEGYNTYSKKEIKELTDFYKRMFDGIEIIKAEKKQTRAVRKPKQKSAAELVKKLKFKPSDGDFGLSSIPPADIIDATALVVFNTKNRKLGIYYAQEHTGFKVKGTTLQFYDENRSLQKTVRKPDEVLPNWKKVTKHKLKAQFGYLKTTETKLNGRFNADTIILKAFK
jgi:hypothetical protein